MRVPTAVNKLVEVQSYSALFRRIKGVEQIPMREREERRERTISRDMVI